MARRAPRIFGFKGPDDFEAPDLVKHHPLANADVQLLKSISKDLSHTGVTERKDSREPVAVLEEVTEIFSDALSYAKYEKDLNSDFYRPEVEALVQAREAREGDSFSNPSLDGIDDYGRQMYEAAPEEGGRTAPFPVMHTPRSRSRLEVSEPLVPSRVEPDAPAEEPVSGKPLSKKASDEDTRDYEQILARLSVPISYVE